MTESSSEEDDGEEEVRWKEGAKEKEAKSWTKCFVWIKMRKGMMYD